MIPQKRLPDESFNDGQILSNQSERTISRVMKGLVKEEVQTPFGKFTYLWGRDQLLGEQALLGVTTNALFKGIGDGCLSRSHIYSVREEMSNNGSFRQYVLNQIRRKHRIYRDMIRKSESSSSAWNIELSLDELIPYSQNIGNGFFLPIKVADVLSYARISEIDLENYMNNNEKSRLRPVEHGFLIQKH